MSTRNLNRFFICMSSYTAQQQPNPAIPYPLCNLLCTFENPYYPSKHPQHSSSLLLNIHPTDLLEHSLILPSRDDPHIPLSASHNRTDRHPLFDCPPRHLLLLHHNSDIALASRGPFFPSQL